jgi:hypothetical protein
MKHLVDVVQGAMSWTKKMVLFSDGAVAWDFIRGNKTPQRGDRQEPRRSASISSILVHKNDHHSFERDTA